MSPAEQGRGDRQPSPGPQGARSHESHAEPSGRPGGTVYDWYHRGLELLKGGDPEAAAHLLAHASKAEPGSRSVREALARALFDSRRYAEAAEQFRRIVADSPVEDYARFGLGLSLSRLGEPEAAVEHLALAVAMRPDEHNYANALRGARATLRARRTRD